MTTRRDFSQLLLLAAIPGIPSGARATAHPLRSLQLVVPTLAGAQPDLIARWLVGPMSESAGVTGMVLNRPGAAGAIAADTVLAAPADSGSLLLGGLDAVAYSHLNNNRRRLDPFVDFAPIGSASRDTWMLVVPQDSPSVSISELVDASRKTPLNYASIGEGSTPHLLTARFVRGLRIDATHIPYKQSYMPDLIARRIDFVIAPTPAVLPQVRSDQLRALASLTDERLEVARDIPSIRELGWPNQVFYAGLFLFAPAALLARVEEINQWLQNAIRQPSIRRLYREAGIEPVEHDVGQAKQAIAERLRDIDAMREAVFGRKHSDSRSAPRLPQKLSWHL